MKVSHSKVELYSLCPAKFKFNYIDNLEALETYSPLLFGGAVDKALNYILTRTKRDHKVYLETANAIFIKNMRKWDGTTKFVFFKNEMPEVMPDDVHEEDAVWEHLCSIGLMMLSTYVEEILPKFKEIIAVQTRKEIPNEEGDVLVLITDFTARLHDDRVVTFDNKTTTDLKKNYGPTSVAKSQQLAIYAEFAENRLAGYIAMSKKLKDGKIQWTMVVDEVPEEQSEKAFEKVDAALRGIKAGEFNPNPKACFSFGKLCIYKNYCQYNDDKGLVKKCKR